MKLRNQDRKQQSLQLYTKYDTLKPKTNRESILKPKLFFISLFYNDKFQKTITKRTHLQLNKKNYNNEIDSSV